MPDRYHELNAAKIIETTEKLSRRIQERFPESGLGRLGQELVRVTQDAADRAARIRRPNIPLRLGAYGLSMGIIGLIGWTIATLEWREFRLVQGFVGFVEPALGAIVFVGAAIIYILSVDARQKRNRAISAVHELRSFAHIIDMHQLTKDPDRTLAHKRTASSPELTMTPFLMGRYLDYCTELLSIVGKIGALYVQGFPDVAATSAVDQLDVMTNGLSRKIWQKMTLIGSEETAD